MVMTRAYQYLSFQAINKKKLLQEIGLIFVWEKYLT